MGFQALCLGCFLLHLFILTPIVNTQYDPPRPGPKDPSASTASVTTPPAATTVDASTPPPEENPTPNTPTNETVAEGGSANEATTHSTLIGVTAGSVAVVLTILLTALLCYRYNKRKVEPTPGASIEEAGLQISDPPMATTEGVELKNSDPPITTTEEEDLQISDPPIHEGD